MWKLQGTVDTTENWAYLEQAFTKDQCQEIINIGESLLPQTATIVGGECKDVRDSKVSWIRPSQESEPFFRQVTDIVNSLNSQFFKFDLEGFAEGFQFTKYEAPAGKYDLHIDKTYMQQVRKLSLVIQLSDPSEYEGGDLVLKFGKEDVVAKKQQGFLTMFPSYVLHGVTPVTSGTRYSLVAWVTGPQFK